MSSLINLSGVSVSLMEGADSKNGYPAVWDSSFYSTAPNLYSTEPESRDNFNLLTSGFQSLPIAPETLQQLPLDLNATAPVTISRRQWMQTILLDDEATASISAPTLKQEDHVTALRYGRHYPDRSKFRRQQSFSAITPASKQHVPSPATPIKRDTSTLPTRPITKQQQHISARANTATHQAATLPKQTDRVGAGSKRKLDDRSDNEEEDEGGHRSVDIRGGDARPGYIIDAVTGRERKRRMIDDFPRQFGILYEEERRRERFLAAGGQRVGMIDTCGDEDNFAEDEFEEIESEDEASEHEASEDEESEDEGEGDETEEDESEEEDTLPTPPPSHYRCELTGNLRKWMLVESVWGPERRKEWLRTRFDIIMAKPAEEREGEWFENGDSELDFSEWEEEKKLRIQRKANLRKAGRRGSVEIF